MAKASIKVRRTRKKTVTVAKVDKKTGKIVKGGSVHCPVCGKFMSRSRKKNE